MVRTRLLPPRANGPTLTLALASIEMRNMVSAVSATSLTIVTWSKIASVSGSFFGVDSWPLSAGNSPDHSIWCRWFRPWAVRYPRSLCGRSTDAAPRPPSGEYRGGWSGMGCGLALAIDDGWDIRQEVGEMCFRTLPPAQGKGIDTDHAAVEFVQAFTNGHPPPPQF